VVEKVVTAVAAPVQEEAPENEEVDVVNFEASLAEQLKQLVDDLSKAPAVAGSGAGVVHESEDTDEWADSQDLGYFRVPMWVATPDAPPSELDTKDPYESQIGGIPKIPEWVSFDVKQARCGVCGYPLYLLLQAYCPYGDLERIFLVMACNTAACQTQVSKSWKVWRFQRQHEEQAQSSDSEADSETEDSTDPPKGNDRPELPAVSGAENQQANSSSNAAEDLHASGPFTLPAFTLDMFEEPEKGDTEVNVAEELHKMETINAGTDQLITVNDLDDVTQSLPQCQVDTVFLRFQRRMQRCPRQVVRWGIGGQPLWISDECLPSTIPPCVACGAPRVMELQLMPTLVYFLKPYRFSHVTGDEGIDFGTVTVYSCVAMCTGAPVCPEHVHVQPPPSK